MCSLLPVASAKHQTVINGHPGVHNGKQAAAQGACLPRQHHLLNDLGKSVWAKRALVNLVVLEGIVAEEGGGVPEVYGVKLKNLNFSPKT